MADSSSSFSAQTINYTGTMETAQTTSQYSGSGTAIVFDTFLKFLRYVSGFALLGLGVFLLYFILSEIYAAYQDISSNAFIGSMINWLTDKPIIYLPEQHSAYMLGQAGAATIAVLIACLIASMALRAACHFFTTGIRVLQIRT